MTRAEGLPRLLDRIAPLRERIATHPLGDRLRDPASIATFMEHHVFAVWDFMSLLKGLQRALTSVELPWRPIGSARNRRLVNQIVTGEESDEIDGVPTGHFEFYLRAMRQAGAATGAIERVLAAVERGASPGDAMDRAGAPAAAAAFVRATFASIDPARPHAMASVFTFGREDAVPAMFAGLARSVEAHAGRLDLFATYLRRHVELDGDEHGPAAIALVCDLCGGDGLRWEEATVAAGRALAERLALWDAIAAALPAPAVGARMRDLENTA